jgi:putative Mn2+ efflux pump MntP
MAVATSIDALAVCITFAFLEVNLLLAIAIIGITTFALCALGVLVGHKFGARFKNKASIAGGVVLILIGAKILLEHLGILVL